MRVPRLRQKIFFLGAAANVAMIGSSVLGVSQGDDAAEQQEEANQQAAKEQHRHNLAMEEAAQNNPGAVQSNYSFFSNASGFAKDLWKNQKSNITAAAGMGLGLAATNYLGNRVLTSVKDHENGDDSDTKNFLAKAAVGVGTIGGGIMAAKKGLLGKKAADFMNTGQGASFLKGINPIVRDETTKKISWGGTAMKNLPNAAFIALPTAMYMMGKKSQNDMVDNTQHENQSQQTEYSVLTGITQQRNFGIGSGNIIGRALDSTWGWMKRVKADPKGTLSSAAGHVGSFAGFYGHGGTKATQEQVSNLAELGKQSGNAYTQKAAEWMKKNPNATNVLYGVGALGVGTGITSAADFAIDTPMKAIDKHTYESTAEDNDLL